MMKKQSIISVAALAFLLSACGSGMSLGLGLGGFGSHIGGGASINIPLGGQNKTDSVQADNTQTQEQKVITYFDAQGQASESAVKGGYYRQLIAKQSEQEYVVQDFYDNGSKRTDPMVLSKEQLFVFRAHPAQGAYTVYAINGNIMQQQNFRDGKLISQ